MTFGYNTTVAKGYVAVNQGNVFSHARDLLYGLEAKRRTAPDRDLVLIAHSLGGILVKEVLRASETDPDPKITKIFSATTGVFFFGTPHRGSKYWASLGKQVVEVASAVLQMDANTEVLRALLPGSRELELCQRSFVAQWIKRGEGLTVRTFQESRGLAGTRLGGQNRLVSSSGSSCASLCRLYC
jgi:hypothetical protein